MKQPRRNWAVASSLTGSHPRGNSTPGENINMWASMRIRVCFIATAVTLLLSAALPLASAQLAQTREAAVNVPMTNPVPRPPGLGHGSHAESSAPTAPPSPRGGVSGSATINRANFHALPSGFALATSGLAATDGPMTGKSPTVVPVFVYEGSYRITGQGANGSAYTGTGTISRLGGNMYTYRVSVGSNVFTGAGILDRGGALCFGWAAKIKDASVAAYDVMPDGTWDGLWFQAGDSTLGRELATPIGANGATRRLSGRFPNGGSYSGTLKVARLGSLSTEEFVTDNLTWDINGGPSHGVAVSIGGLVAAGFADTGKEFGTELLVPSAKRDGFTGPWVQSINGFVSVGTETWIRQ